MTIKDYETEKDRRKSRKVEVKDVIEKTLKRMGLRPYKYLSHPEKQPFLWFSFGLAFS